MQKSQSTAVTHDVTSIAVAFGPTPINPKQLFLLKFDEASFEDIDKVKLQKLGMDASRAIVRQCIGSGLSEFDSPCLRQKIYVMASIRQQELSSHDGSIEQEAGIHGKCFPIILYVGSHQFCSSAPEESTFLAERRQQLHFAESLQHFSLVAVSVLHGLASEKSSGSGLTSVF
eukprot:755483-Hanusia_phi.AAC.2